MAFVETAYDSDQGVTMRLRMSTEEFAAVTASATAIDFEAHAYASGSRRRFGVHTRGVNLSRTRGTAPNTFKDSTFLSIPTVAEYDALAIGDAITIDSVAWTIAKKVDEVAV